MSLGAHDFKAVAAGAHSELLTTTAHSESSLSTFAQQLCDRRPGSTFKPSKERMMNAVHQVLASSVEPSERKAAVGIWLAL